MSLLRTILTGRRPVTAMSSAAAALVQPAPIEMDDEQRYRPIDWVLVRRLLRELSPYRFQYASGVALGLVHVLLDMAGPAFIAHLIDYCTGYIRKTGSITESQAINHVLLVMLLWTLSFVCSVALQRWCI